ncbi:MAG: sugar phosphate isomerase/epimerase family protein [bacterium]
MKTCLVLTPEKSKFSPLLFAGNIDFGIKYAAELGYEGIEINIRDSAKIDQKHIINLLNSHNLKLVSIGTGQAYYEDGISLASRDKTIREKAVNRLKDHIRFASKSGAQVVIGSIRGTFSSNLEVKNKEFEGALQAIKACVDFASECKVTLTIEPINRNETNFINTMKEAIEFIKQINSKNVKLLADTYQLNFDGMAIPDALRLAGDLLVHVHLVDSDRLVPGCGRIDFQSVLKALKEINYQEYLSGEILPVPDDERAARQYIKNVQKLLATI